jgi:hypothetical protein
LNITTGEEMGMLWQQRLVIPLALVLLSIMATAGVAAPAAAAGFAGATPVSDAQLAHMRGGFSIGNGRDTVKLSLDIERRAIINGKLQEVSRPGSAAGDRIRLIQNGQRNQLADSVLNGVPAGSLGTVIQNSLDGQAIRNVNVFNITVTSRQIAHSLAIQDTVRDALTSAMR